MTPDELAARARAARQVTIGPFLVQLPDQLTIATRVAAVPRDDEAAMQAFEETFPVECLIGWDLTVGDVVPGDAEAAQPLVFDPGYVPVLFAERRDLRGQLLQGFWEALKARRERLEADRGN